MYPPFAKGSLDANEYQLNKFIGQLEMESMSHFNTNYHEMIKGIGPLAKLTYT